MKELVSKCMALPYEDRAILAKMLNESIQDVKRFNAAERYKTLLCAATSLLGQGIDGKCRDRRCIIGRMFIAYKMRQEGFSLNQIGIMMGRNHATILYMQKKMVDVIQYRFKEELGLWERFNNILNDGIYK